MNRAYSLLTVKAVEDDQRVIRGTATTPSPDRMGDIVEPMGVQFANPMPLLHQHDAKLPVGTVTFDKPTKNGITFEAKLPKIDDPGPLKDRVDTAWGEVKAGLVRGVSIGFRPIEYSFMDDGGMRFAKSEILELSLVTVPANGDCTIQTIKSIDATLLASSGHKQGGVKSLPVVSGSHQSPNPRKGVQTMASKTIAEQIAAFEATRQAKAARMTEIMSKSAEDGSTLDDAQAEEYDGLEVEIKSIDAHLVRLAAAERANIAKAVPPEGRSADGAAQSRAGVRVEVKGSNLPKGTAFTRYAMALMASKGNLMQAEQIAKRWDDSTPEVGTVIKAAVNAGTTTDATWAKPLVEYQNMTAEFAELLRPATIIGRIPGLRRVPFNIKVPRQTGGSSASWVGEGAPKPVGSLAFDQITLGETKVAGIVVMTQELVRFSNPSAEAIVRQDLVDTISQLLDRDFVDPDKAAAAGVSPASITNGVTAVVATGTTSDHLRADVKTLFGNFLAVNLSIAGAAWIMTETQSLAIAMMTNPLGQPEFPGMTIANGQTGTFFGLPVILSENIPAQAAVTGPPAIPAGSRIILAKASEIMLADDGQVTLDASSEASLQMDSAPTNPPVAATVMVSLWQMNMVGIRAERFINWTKRRPGAVQYITGAAYAD